MIKAMSDPPEKEALPARKVRKATPALPDLPEQQAPPGRKASREYKVRRDCRAHRDRQDRRVPAA